LVHVSPMRKKTFKFYQKYAKTIFGWTLSL